MIKAQEVSLSGFWTLMVHKGIDIEKIESIFFIF